MEAVHDIKHFSALVKEAKSPGKTNVSNCYLLPDAINEYTRQQRLFWEKVNDGIVFFCKERDFYYLYFYLVESQEQAGILLTKRDKPIVIDLVYSESQEPSWLSEIKKRWVKSGFCIYKTYRRMSLNLPPEENLPAEQIFVNNNHYELRYASAQDYEDVQKLWRCSLDIFSTALLYENELKKLLNEKQLLALYDQDNKIAAVLQFQRKGKTGFIDHVVVNEKHRNRGLAKALLHAGLTENRDINKCYLWVDENNIPAKMFYLKSGFSFDGKISCQLLLKN
jgi:ribosomal protein S18 acetylase RimI-like enzyme